MSWFSIQELEYLLRIVLAAVCGGAIGFERERRSKSAGIRTHIIVALSAALMMVVSKYGFFDVIGLGGISLDASRVAAGVVTAYRLFGRGGHLYPRADGQRRHHRRRPVGHCWGGHRRGGWAIRHRRRGHGADRPLPGNSPPLIPPGQDPAYGHRRPGTERGGERSGGGAPPAGGAGVRREGCG